MNWRQNWFCKSKGYILCSRVSLVAQMVKNLLAMWENWVRSLDQKDPLEKEMAAHSSILAWRISWKEEPGRLQSLGSQESDTNLVTKPPLYYKGFPSGSAVKNPPTMWELRETWVQWIWSLGRFNPWVGKRSLRGEHDNPLHFSWEIPWTEKPAGLQSIIKSKDLF